MKRTECQACYRVNRYEIDIPTEDEESSKRQEDLLKTDIFVSTLDVDETLAQLLVSEGFGSVEEIIETDESELLSIEGFDEEIVSELIERAKKYLADKEEENQLKIETLNVSKDLTQFELLSKAMIVKLAESDIKTLDDFAGLTTDDLIGYLEVKGIKFKSDRIIRGI